MTSAIDQLVAALPYIGDVGSIVRTPNGFLVRVGSTADRPASAFEVQIDESYKPSFDPNMVAPMHIGWYQDDKAEMFYYEGEGYWREVGLVKSKDLTGKAALGQLEYIG